MHLGGMTCDIKLSGKYRMRGVHSIEIKKSVHQMVQTAKVELPLSVMMRNNELLERVKLADKVKEGDTISLAFGYDGNNKEEFTGYIRRINPKQPLELECEDEMYLLRKVYLKKSFTKNDVKDLLQYVIDEVYKAHGVRFKLHPDNAKETVKNFRIKGANGLEVLQELADKYFLSSRLVKQNGELLLYCGLTYGLKTGNRIKHVLNRNTISIDDLKFRTSEQTYHIKIRNIKPDGTLKDWEFGDKNGIAIQEQTVHGFKTEAQLKHIADAEFEKMKTGGYIGSFEQFLIPAVEPGDISIMTDPQFESRGGNYYIGSVITTFSTNGGRRKPEVDIRVL